MARGTGAIYPSERNKGFGLEFQSPDEGWSVQWPKCVNMATEMRMAV